MAYGNGVAVNQAAKREQPNGHSGRSRHLSFEHLHDAHEKLPACADKREHPRDATHDLSEIILDGRTYGIACLILDVSSSGAKLEVSCGELPKRFILANYTKRTKTLCRQVWRDNRLVGVKFLTNPRAFAIEERL
jgi:hypothetical protein